MQAVFTQHFTSADLMHVCTRVSEPRSVLTFDQPRSASRLPQPSSGMLIASRTPGALARAAIGCIYPGVARQAPRAAGFSTTTQAAAAGHMEVLQPASVFKYFHELTQLPRPSKHEHRCVCHASCGSRTRCLATSTTTKASLAAASDDDRQACRIPAGYPFGSTSSPSSPTLPHSKPPTHSPIYPSHPPTHPPLPPV